MNRKTAGAFLASAALALASLPVVSFAEGTSTPPYVRGIERGVKAGIPRDAQVYALSQLLGVSRADAVNLLALKSFNQVVQEKNIDLATAKAKVQSVEREAQKVYWRALGVPEAEITARIEKMQSHPSTVKKFENNKNRGVGMKKNK